MSHPESDIPWETISFEHEREGTVVPVGNPEKWHQWSRDLSRHLRDNGINTDAPVRLPSGAGIWWM